MNNVEGQPPVEAAQSFKRERGSRTVLRGTSGEAPLVYSPVLPQNPLDII